MSNNEDISIDETADEGPRDSRLQSFLRQASAIIASEKGFTNVAKAKLDDLAQRLHLPEELFEEGLQELQNSNSPVGDLTDYEKGFLKFLIHEFSQKPKGAVLSISMEEKAVAYASDRFGILANRAEQLIDYQASESGIGRLSRTDARQFGRQMILDIIGDHVVLDAKTEDRIFRIGRRWGCDVLEVEGMITTTLAQNVEAIRREHRKPKILGVATMACLILIGVAGWWFVENRESIFGTPVVKKDPVTVILDPPPDPEKTKSVLETAFPDFATSLSSEDFVARGDAIESMTKKLLGSQKQNGIQFDAIKTWYLQEPDPQVADRFEQSIQWALKSEPVSNLNNALALPYRAAKMAQDIADSSQLADPHNRKETLAQILKSEFPASSTPVETVIANRQWNQVIQNSWQDPGRNSILIEPLTKLTLTRLGTRELQQFLSRGVRTIILADRTQWRNMESSIRTAIESADDVQRMEWIDIWIDDFDDSSGFRKFAGPSLIAGSLRDPKPVARDYAKFLKAERSDWRNRRLRPALLRHEQISSSIEKLDPYFASISESSVNPDLIFQTASAANLCLEAMSIMDSGRAGDVSAWSEVDVQLERFDSRLRDFVFLDEQGGQTPKVSSAGFDTTLRDRTIAAFNDLSEGNQARRLAAIDRLPSLIAKFNSIPQPKANSLATYLLSPIEADEWLQTQRVVTEFAKWPRLVVAIADQLPESDAPIDQVMTMYSVLTGEPWNASADGNWREAMSLSLLKWSHESLLASDAVDPNSSNSDWIRLEKFLQTAYFRRSTLLGVENVELSRSVVGNAKQCVRAVSENLAATDRAIGLIEESSGGEMESVIALNQMISGARGSAKPSSAGLRLLESELKLLQIWNRERRDQLKGVIDGS